MKPSLLDKELETARSYQLLTTEFGLLDLSAKNVALVEAMISIDSDYCRAADEKAAPDSEEYSNDAVLYWFDNLNKEEREKITKKYNGKYKGSTAYWIKRLGDGLCEGCDDNELRKRILSAVLAIDRDNSTHITSDGVGPVFLTERILEWFKYHIIDDLKEFEVGRNLIQKLSEETPKGYITDLDKYKQRSNYSFATKFCHYICFFLFQGDDRDIYSIYDGVVAKILPYYLKSHNIFKKDGKPYRKCDFDSADKYKEYSNVIDKLRDGKISRNGFDHLLWYYHKGRPHPKTNE